MENDYPIMLKNVIDFISNHLGIDKSKLNENTKIEDDVGIAGLDTISFYEDFFCEFQIDNPHDFNSDKFISPENMNFYSFFKSIFSKNTNKELEIENITIRHLTNVAIKRKWYEE